MEVLNSRSGRRLLHNSSSKSPESSSAGQVADVVYCLSRNGQLDQPHLIQLPLSDGRLYLRDVISRLNSLRGNGMAGLYSWSCKRSYKNGFVWHDLAEDDLVYPAHGREYVLKGSELLQLVDDTDGAAPPSAPAGVVRRRRNLSCSAIDLHQEYKVYKTERAAESESVSVFADASTQTDDKRRRRRAAMFAEAEEGLVLVEEEEKQPPPPPTPPQQQQQQVEVLSRGEISPPPSDSSPETLESLMKSELLRTPAGKTKPSSALMQLISWGFRDCRPGAYGSLISQYSRSRSSRGEALRPNTNKKKK